MTCVRSKDDDDGARIRKASRGNVCKEDCFYIVRDTQLRKAWISTRVDIAEFTLRSRLVTSSRFYS